MKNDGGRDRVDYNRQMAKSRSLLPPLDKAVVYLDQFAISNLFKAKTSKEAERDSHKEYWASLLTKVERAVLLHQAIFPSSSIHLDETIPYHSPSDLQIFHETLGDAEFCSPREIVAEQEWAFFEAYLEGRPRPTLSTSVDEVLKGERNIWLPALHITGKTDWTVIAPMVRRDRDVNERAMKRLADRWKEEKPTFEEALSVELAALAEVRKDQLLNTTDMRVVAQFSEMRKAFEAHGFKEAVLEVVKFWEWPENQHLPEHRISAHLFAALARQYAGNRKKEPLGIMNDIKAVASYGPYVDAIFVDNHCATLVKEANLSLKARVFSLNSGDAFAAYIDDLCERASPEVRAFALQRFGVK